MNKIILDNKIALVGDPHIGVNKDSEEFLELTEKWFKYFIEDIKTKGITDVFILGDWHHCRDEISVKTLDFSAKVMNLFPPDMRVFISTGNHDCYLKDTSEIHSLQQYKNWENVEVFDKLTTVQTKSGNTVMVVPWGDNVPVGTSTDYIFGHFEITNFKWNSYTICDNGIDSNSLVNNGAKVYTGHFHQRQTKEYPKGSITYVGSPIQHNFNDVDNSNGYHILDFTTGECEFIENIGYPVFKYIKLSKLKSVTREDVEGNFVKLFIDIDGTNDKTIDKATSTLMLYNPRKLLIDDKMSKVVNIDGEITGDISEINILKSIKEFIDLLGEIEYKDEIIKKLTELYNSKVT